ncbi:glycine oxidase ThiO [Corynebacterium otitidis]
MRAIVIGAGAVGLACAFELTERGLDVEVVDPDPAGGATHFAGGMLAPVAEVQYRQEPLYPMMLEAAELYPSFIERLSGATDLPTGYDTAGTLVVAADRADARHLAELAEHQGRFARAPKRLTVREARRLEPGLSPGLAGAVSIEGDHQVFPRALAEALLDALKNRGARLVRESATRLRTAAGPGSRVTAVETTGGEIDADGAVVVLANGLGAHQVGGWFEGPSPLKLRPVFGDILIAESPAGEPPLVKRVIRGFVNDRPIYLIPRGRRLAIGATSREDERDRPPLGAIYGLLRDAVRVCPGVEELGLVEAGTGARPGTPDDLPYLGKAAENLVISTGYFRHGILLAPLGAAVAAVLATGETGGRLAEVAAPADPLRHAGRG